MSRRNLLSKQDSSVSSGSLQRQATKSNMQKSLFSKFSNTLFKGPAGSNDEEEIQFFTKGKENCLRILMFMMVNYDGMEQYLKKQSVLVPINTYSYIQKSYTDLSPLRIELIYYFQIISIRDFHDFYIDFYATFDKNKNFSLEPAEFRQLLDLAMNKCVGPKKFKVFTDICLVETSQYDNQLDFKMMNEIIDNFRDVEREEKIDYLQLFPYILSFFLEHTYQQIKYKQGRIDLMRGTEIIKGKEVEIKNITSLVTILREMGIDYLRDKHYACLTYRDVENVLIKLKNIHKWITFDIIKQIINQLSKLMEVDPKTQNEGKPLKLHKIINFLALKLCIHQNCQHLSKLDKNKSKPPSAYLEILVLWNAAMYGQIMKESTLKGQFQKFLDKHYREYKEFKRPEALKVLEQFFKKKFQLMPKDQIKNILELHSEIQGKKIIQTPISADNLTEELFQMMCKDGYRKIQEYIRICFDGVNKATQDQINQYQHQKGKDFYDEQIQSPNSSDKMQKSPKFDEKSIKSQQQQAEKMKSESSDSEREKRDNPKNKLKRVAKVITSQQAFAQQVDQKKDVLKACLIMDSFLKRQNQIYQKMQQSKYQAEENKTPTQSQQLEQMDPQQIDQQQEYEIRLQNGFDNQSKREESKQKEKESKKKGNKEEIKKQEEDHEPETKKKVEVVRPKIVIKDLRHNYQDTQSSDLLMVAGQLGKNYGPQNFKNAYYNQALVQQQNGKQIITNNQIKSQLYSLTDDDFKDEEGKFQVVIDDIQLQKQIQIQQNIAKSKKPKDRSTCYYCQIM